MAMVKFEYSCTSICLDEIRRSICFKQEWIKTLLEKFGIVMNFNKYDNVTSIEFNNPDYETESFFVTNDGKGALARIGCQVTIYYKDYKIGSCYISGSSYRADTEGVFSLYVKRLEDLWS